jgi:trimeric autotransporter adhesin
MKSFVTATLLLLAGLFGSQHSPAPVALSAAAAESFPVSSSLATTSTATPTTTNAASASTLQVLSRVEPTDTGDYVTQDQFARQLAEIRSLIYTITGSSSTAFTDPQVAGNGDGVYSGETAAPITSLNASALSGLTASEIPDLSSSYLSTAGGALTGTTTVATSLGVGTADPLNALDINGSGAIGSYAGTYIAPSDGLIVSGDVGIGTTSPVSALSVLGNITAEDTEASSTATLGAEQVSDGSFTSNPTSAWTLGSGWSWDSTNNRAQFTGSGGPIASIAIDTGGSGYSNGDTITISGGSGDATYTATVSGGVVTKLTQVSAGTIYTTGTGISTTGGTGSGLVVSIVQIANSSGTLSETVTTSPNQPTTSYTLPLNAGDITYTGTTYRVAFTIANYSGKGQIEVSFGQALSVGGNDLGPNSGYYSGNGNYVVTLIATSSVLTFTPTGDFNGELTNVSAKSITPLTAVGTIENSDGSSALEFRPGGVMKWNTYIGVGAGENYTSGNIYDEGFNTGVGYLSMYSNTSGAGNTALGFYTLFSNTTGSTNVAVGNQVLQDNTTGGNNTALGYLAMVSNTTGSSNTALGAQANRSNTTGADNTSVGVAALFNNTTGSNNTAIGFDSLETNRTGTRDNSIGYNSLFSNTTGSDNIALGYTTLTLNTTGAQNVAIGNEALDKNGTGSSNTGVGYLTLFNATTTSNNTAVGWSAMEGSTGGALTISGSNDTAFGYRSLLNYINGSNNTAIGYEAMEDATTSSSSVAVGYLAGGGTSNNDAYTGLTAIGYQTGHGLSNGSNFNTFIGYQAGYNVTTGADNILIGSATSSTAIANLTTGSMNILIGDNISFASTTANGQLDIGNLIDGTGLNGNGSTLATGDIGIGNSSPYARLSVKGPDSASSTLAFNVVNSASTTVLAVFDGGNAQLSGTLTQSSDQRLKTNIQSLDASSSLSLIDELNPVTFTWINPDQGTTPQLGFIAQQVQQIFPNLVSTTSATALTPDGTLGLNYIGLISPIVSAIQEIGNIGGTFEQSLIAWLGNAQNGIGALFAQVGNFGQVNANELCVGSTCVTPAQFQAMVAAVGQSGVGTIESATTSDATNTPPQIQITGDNPALIQVGATYNDLGATITGPQEDLNLGIQTFVNGAAMSPVEIDTSQAATDTIDYVVADQKGLTSTSTRTIIIEAPSIAPTVDASTTADTTTAASTTSQ